MSEFKHFNLKIDSEEMLIYIVTLLGITDENFDHMMGFNGYDLYNKLLEKVKDKSKVYDIANNLCIVKA
jgi:hypothetical protein